MAAEPAPASAGLLYHACLEVETLVHRRRLGYVSLLADQFLARPESWPALRRLGSFLPLVSHGVAMSLGSAEGLDGRYLDGLAAFLDAVRPAWHGEHASFSRAGGHDVGHFVPLPRTAAAVAVLARNARQARCALPCPLILENVASAFAWPGGWGEADFHAALAEAADCRLLLDLHNLHADAVNLGFDAAEELARWPLERIAELHAAGGYERGSWLVDSHTRRPPEAVHDLLAQARALGCAAPVTLEWDDELPPFEELLRQVDLLRIPAGPARAVTHRVPPAESASGPALAGLQARLARAMLEADSEADAGFGLRVEDVRRARRAYARKREKPRLSEGRRAALPAR